MEPIKLVRDQLQPRFAFDALGRADADPHSGARGVRQWGRWGATRAIAQDAAPSTPGTRREEGRRRVGSGPRVWGTLRLRESVMGIRTA